MWKCNKNSWIRSATVCELLQVTFAQQVLYFPCSVQHTHAGTHSNTHTHTRTHTHTHTHTHTQYWSLVCSNTRRFVLFSRHCQPTKLVSLQVFNKPIWTNIKSFLLHVDMENSSSVSRLAKRNCCYQLKRADRTKQYTFCVCTWRRDNPWSPHSTLINW